MVGYSHVIDIMININVHVFMEMQSKFFVNDEYSKGRIILIINH
jgi:hypothetical protein